MKTILPILIAASLFGCSSVSQKESGYTDKYGSRIVFPSFSKKRYVPHVELEVLTGRDKLNIQTFELVWEFPNVW